MEAIVIKRQPEIKSLVSVARYILLRMPYLKIVAFFAAFILVVNLFGYGQQKPGTAASEWISFLFVFLVWGVIIYSVDCSIQKNLARNPKNLEPQTLTFTSNSLTSEGQTYQVEYPWESIHKIKETRRWILFYINKTSALPIEKENLTDIEYNDLKKLLASLNVKKQLMA